MGYLKPTAIVVHADYMFDDEDHWIDIARREAHKIYLKYGLSHLISPIVYSGTNDVRSFLCAWDGSKEDWETSDKGELAQSEFVKWLHMRRFIDGTSPLKWVQIVYSDEIDPPVDILSHNSSTTRDS